DVTYTCWFTVTGLDSTHGMAVEILYSDLSSETHQVNTNGRQSFTFSYTGSADNVTALIIISPSPHIGITSENFTLSNFYIYTPGNDNKSGAFTFATGFAFPTMLFTATNNDSAFGFDYSKSFTHYLRVWGNIKYNGYTEEKEVYNFSDNTNLLLTASQLKQYEISIGDAAEYVHDCLSILRLHDTFTINDKEYIPDGDYALQVRKSTFVLPAKFTVKEQAGPSKNYAL
ncbi:MAG TPA: hypothetical protein VG603_12740, partial [Chitinophagales bacterium]|nr:hypothetical protein [Chitinophagales bacterium]